MNDDRDQTADFQMSAITCALETRPVAPVPDDFAERVMARLPQQRAHRLVVPAEGKSISHYGRLTACVSMVLLLMGMTFLAPRTQGSDVWLALQALLFIEFCALLLWITTSRRHLL